MPKPYNTHTHKHRSKREGCIKCRPKRKETTNGASKSLQWKDSNQMQPIYRPMERSNIESGRL